MNSGHKPRLSGRPEVLLVEDDAQIRRFLRAMLAVDGYRVYEAGNSADGLAQAAARNPDLVLLDLGLPDSSGLQIIREVRKWSHMPIIVISAKTTERDKIEALDAGADDYVTKPFAAGEVSARIRSAFRRLAAIDRNDVRETVSFGTVEINLGSRRVFVDGHDVHLTPNEYKLIQVLLRHAGSVVTHRQLLKEVWGPEHLEELQYLRVFMRQLRSKLEEDPANPKYLITEPGIGYRLLIESMNVMKGTT